MWVKICGNTSYQDASLAIDAGADAVGFIFARSPRQLTPAEAAAITRRLPATTERVGVFDSVDAEKIASVAGIAELHTVQLHSLPDPLLHERLRLLLGTGVRIIQTVHWTLDPDPAAPDPASTLRAQLHQLISLPKDSTSLLRVMIDSKVGDKSGGTGKFFDWTAASPVLAEAQAEGLRIIAAGGLRPGNVAEAITLMRPWGVDVSSGVEAAPGRKNPDLVREFLAQAHGVQKP